MIEQAWAPQGVDVEQPNPARIYDYMLGGGHNFAADREAADYIVTLIPQAREVVRCNRAFLRRAVLFLVRQGVRQFLDLGSGVPTVGNVHEIAQQADPRARVVYVDKEPIAVTHSRLLLRDNEQATVLQADLREPETILNAPQTRQLLDFDQPIGLLTVSVLHFMPDHERPGDILRAYRDQLAPGSYLALSHATADTHADEVARAMEVYRRSGSPVYPREHAEISALFTGFELVEPGVVHAAAWHPESPDDCGPGVEFAEVLAGVARKP